MSKSSSGKPPSRRSPTRASRPREADRPVRLTDAEWVVMEAVWDGVAVRARDVLERVHAQTGWSYSTVKTQLTRLVEKGVLQEGRDANAATYDALITRDDARRTALRSLLDAAFGGRVGELVQHMAAAEHLSAREKRALGELLGGDEGSRR
jgi:BlaI family penicillinase repressor